jgi:AraC family transcriptional activator FtrA
MPKVAILVFEQVAMFELACATELFSLPRPEFENWYQTKFVSFERAPFATVGGLQLFIGADDSLAEFDTLIIPSWSTQEKRVKLNMAQSIADFSERGGRVISFCSGAFLLAQLGLLQGQSATTHWRYAEVFKRRFPNVDYLEDVLYTQSNNIFCSAGSASALDLGLEIIRQDFGYQVANQVARRLVISPQRQGGQAQYVDTPVQKHVGALSKTLDWAILNLDRTLNVDDLANQANMSRRTFDRHFKKSLATSPKAWLNQQRINLAKRLLETENLSIDQLAAKVGYDNGITLRFNFNKHVGISPSQYREQFTVCR